MDRIARLTGWIVLAFCTACASEPAPRPASPHAAALAESEAGPDRLSRVTARLAPALAEVCDCRGRPETEPQGLRLCGTPIKIEPMAALQASTNGQRIRITTGMLRFLERDDELAFVLAHELSHVLLGHAGAFAGRSPRTAEAEADSLGIQLVSAAGFDTEVAARLPERLAQSYPQTNRRSTAYGLPTERRAAITTALDRAKKGQAAFDPQALCSRPAEAEARPS